MGATTTLHALPRPPQSGGAQLVPSAVMAMLIFVVTEIMLFAGFVSAFTIMRRSALVWPPPGQPRLPVMETAANTALLLASGVTLVIAHRAFRRHAPDARTPLLATLLLGSAFVVLQGREWVQLLAAGLTMTSSTLGSFFYLVVGLHALHAVVALGLVASAWSRLRRGFLARSFFGVTEVFWYFVVGIWPLLYWRLYL
ncbi:MAG: cytochrome c oxidase subunit 3 [Deltaproteobacteria bacterium]|nr:cytochrome c oxidase subunit 3 [Deltaproteobacteria bacterium]